MIEALNNTYFIISAILVYLLCLLIILINTLDAAAAIYTRLKGKLLNLINKNIRTQQLYKTITDKIIPALILYLKKTETLLTSISLPFLKFDSFIEHGIFQNIDTPVNYSALLLRKLYDGNPGIWLIYSSLAIVAFYFILTIF